MQKRILSFVPLAGFAACLCLFPGCSGGGGGGSGKTRVAFVTNNPHQFWTIAEAGTKKAADDFGVEVLFRRPHTGDAGVQKEIIDALLTQNVKAIAVSVIDPKNQTPYLNKIAEKVPLITQDNDAPESKRLCYLGTDNYLAGLDVGKLVKQAMPEGGVIAIFVGQMDALNAQQRRQGVLDELAGQKNAKADGEMYGKYKHHATLTDNTDERKAKENVDAVLVQLQNEPNLCLIGLWAYNPPAILKAAADKNALGKVRIVGFDNEEETLKGIKDGHMLGTVVQDPFGFGYESVKLMAALAKGDKSGLPPGGINYVPHRVITKDGRLAGDFKNQQPVEEFHQNLRKLMGK